MRPSDDQVAECVAISHQFCNFLIDLLIGVWTSPFHFGKINLVKDAPNESWDVANEIQVIHGLFQVVSSFGPHLQEFVHKWDEEASENTNLGKDGSLQVEKKQRNKLEEPGEKEHHCYFKYVLIPFKINKLRASI